jgi:hypothetical protein
MKSRTAAAASCSTVSRSQKQEPLQLPGVSMISDTSWLWPPVTDHNKPAASCMTGGSPLRSMGGSTCTLALMPNSSYESQRQTSETPGSQHQQPQ